MKAVAEIGQGKMGRLIIRVYPECDVDKAVLKEIEKAPAITRGLLPDGSRFDIALGDTF